MRVQYLLKAMPTIPRGQGHRWRQHLLAITGDRLDPTGLWVDSSGTVRVKRKLPKFDGLLVLSLTKVIRYGADAPQVVRRLAPCSMSSNPRSRWSGRPPSPVSEAFWKPRSAPPCLPRMPVARRQTGRAAPRGHTHHYESAFAGPSRTSVPRPRRPGSCSRDRRQGAVRPTMNSSSPARRDPAVRLAGGDVPPRRRRRRIW